MLRQLPAGPQQPLHMEAEAEQAWKLLDAKVTEFKTQLDSAAKRDIDAIEQWIADRYQDAQDFADMDMDAAIDETEAVALAQAAAEESNSSAYAYGFGAAGLVGVAAYLYSKKQQKTVQNDEIQFSLV